MTELKTKCDHPDDDLTLGFDLLDRPYYSCQKCGSDISVEEKHSRDKHKDQKTLEVS